MPSLAGRSQSRASSTPVYSPLQRPGRRSRSEKCPENCSPPLPSDLIYKCNVASLFAKSNPRSNRLPFWRLYHQDQRSSFGTRSNYRATEAAAHLLQVLSGSVCPGDAWTLTITCPLPLFPASAGRDVSGFNSLGCWKVISCFDIFSMKFMSNFKIGAYSRVFPDQPEHENRPSDVSPLSW